MSDIKAYTMIDPERLPAPPKAVLGVLSLLDQDDADFSDIKAVVEQDPALAGSYLKVANTVAFGARQVASLDKALRVLGFKSIRTITLASSMASLTPVIPGVQAKEMLERSFTTAVSAQVFMEKSAPVYSEEAFLAGLLKNLGTTAIALVTPEVFEKEFENGYLRANSGFEFLPEELSARIVQNWGIPAIIFNGIADSVNHKGSENPVAAALAFGSAAEKAFSLNDSASMIKLSEIIEDTDLEGSVEELLKEIRVRLSEFGTLMDFEPPAGQTFQDLMMDLMMRLQQDSMNLVTDLATGSKELNIDPLTNLSNRRPLDEWVINGSAQPGLAETVAVFDIDHFKKVNDTYGHQAGDEILKATAKVMQSVVRESDLLVRYGGEEFILIVTDKDPTLIQSIAERIRVTVEQLVVPYDGLELKVTISAGCATLKPGEHRSDLIKRGDANLYAAKQAGRNKVMAS